MKKIVAVLAITSSLIACNNEGETKPGPKDKSEVPANNDSSLNRPDNTNTIPQSDSPANNPAQNMPPDTGLMRRPHQ